MRVIDLSVTIRDKQGRLGLSAAFDTPYKFSECGWQGSTFFMSCHYGTHVDAPNRFIEGASGIDLAPFAKLMGPAALVDLSDHGRGAGISGDTLEQRGRHVQSGDTEILRTGWTDQYWGDKVFRKEGPYLNGDGADWLIVETVAVRVYASHVLRRGRTPARRVTS